MVITFTLLFGSIAEGLRDQSTAFLIHSFKAKEHREKPYAFVDFALHLFVFFLVVFC
jgi:hypothetical protein